MYLKKTDIYGFLILYCSFKASVKVNFKETVKVLKVYTEDFRVPVLN